MEQVFAFLVHSPTPQRWLRFGSLCLLGVLSLALTPHPVYANAKGNVPATQESPSAKSIYDLTQGKAPSTDEGRKAIALYKLWGEDPKVKIEDVRGLLEQASEKGDSEAMVYLGQLKAKGLGGDLDKQGAITLYKKAQALHNPAGTYHLAEALHAEPWSEGRDKRVKELLKEAKRAGYGLAIIGLAKLEMSEGKIEPGKSELIKLANEGNPQAMTILGILYIKGAPGHTTNWRIGLEWLYKAWNLKWPEAGSELYLAFSHGFGGTPINQHKAIRILKKAAQLGSPLAQTNLCIAYKDGHEGGIEKDLDKAYQWCLKAARSGDSHGAYSLAVTYWKKEFKKHSMKKYRKWLRKAADSGYPPASSRLSMMMISGKEGFKREPEKGLSFAKKSAEAGWPEGMYIYAAILADSHLFLPNSKPNYPECWYWSSVLLKVLNRKNTRKLNTFCSANTPESVKKKKQTEIMTHAKRLKENVLLEMFKHAEKSGQTITL